MKRAVFGFGLAVFMLATTGVANAFILDFEELFESSSAYTASVSGALPETDHYNSGDYYNYYSYYSSEKTNSNKKESANIDVKTKSVKGFWKRVFDKWF